MGYLPDQLVQDFFPSTVLVDLNPWLLLGPVSILWGPPTKPTKPTKPGCKVWTARLRRNWLTGDDFSSGFFCVLVLCCCEWKWSVFLSDPLNFSEFEVRHLKFPKQSITRIVKHITLQWKFTYPPKMAYLSRWFSELPVWWDMLIPKVGYVNSQGGIC